MKDEVYNFRHDGGNTMKRYKVKTDKLQDINKGDLLVEDGSRYKLDNDNLVFAIKVEKEIVENNPSWFEKLPEWDLVESAIDGRYYVSNGKTDIYKNVNGYHFAFTLDEADVICEALNELED